MLKFKENLRCFLTQRCPYCGETTDYIVCCPSCASKLLELVNREYGKTVFCDRFEAAFIYQDLVREAVTQFKFHGRPEYVRNFIPILKKCVRSSFDVVLPVPYYKQEEHKREYSTSALLAQYLASALKTTYAKRAVAKVFETKRQDNLEFDERFRNIIGCFSVNPKTVAQKTVLICDDIITSGATINELAKVCKKAGAIRVEAVSFAVAPSAFCVNEEKYL